MKNIGARSRSEDQKCEAEEAGAGFRGQGAGGRGQGPVARGPSNPQSPIPNRRFSSRRGVLLLLILALLAMFGLIAVAFVVLTGQRAAGARIVQRIDVVTDPPQKALQQAAMQVLRGTNSPASVMGAHRLLEEIYGNNTATGTITIVSNTVCGGQLLEFTVSPAPTNPAMRTGCVITVTDPTAPSTGRVRGLSA